MSVHFGLLIFIEGEKKNIKIKPDKYFDLFVFYLFKIGKNGKSMQLIFSFSFAGETELQFEIRSIFLTRLLIQ